MSLVDLVTLCCTTLYILVALCSTTLDLNLGVGVVCFKSSQSYRSCIQVSTLQVINFIGRKDNANACSRLYIEMTNIVFILYNVNKNDNAYVFYFLSTLNSSFSMQIYIVHFCLVVCYQIQMNLIISSKMELQVIASMCI